jgi:hypothetical protein
MIDPLSGSSSQRVGSLISLREMLEMLDAGYQMYNFNVNYVCTTVHCHHQTAWTAAASSLIIKLA